MASNARNIEVRPTTLQNLLAEVANGNYRIPRFQRQFVWKKSKVVDLFDSIYREFPIGSFFLWKAGRSRSRLFRQASALGVGDVTDDDDVTFILDGQQRITSLYATLNGLTIGDTDYSKICFDLLDERFTYRVVGSRVRYVPVCEIWGGDVLAIGRELEQQYFERLSKLYSGLRSYPISLVEVKDKTLSEVCGIFQRINQGGKRLDRFDLITAMTFTEDFDLRERFQTDIITPLKVAGFGEIAPTSATQLLALVVKGSCTESNEFDLRTSEIVEVWAECVKGVALAADLLRKNMGVMEARYLPYEAMLTLLAYYFVISKKRQPDASQLRWIKYWFWRSAFGLRYGSAVATTMSRDRELFDLLHEGSQPTLTQRVELDADDLIRTKMTSTRSAIRNGFLCLLAMNRPVNLAQNAELDLTGVTISSLTEKQKHHIFPWAHLRSKGEYSSSIHALPNFCFLPADLNNQISADAPSDYFSRLANENPDFDTALKRSLIPAPISSGIPENDFLKFLRARSRVILDEIQRVCGQLDRPADSERATRLGAVEVALRDVIDDVMESVMGPGYWRKKAIPQDVRDEAITKATREFGIRSLEEIPARKLLNLCYFSDYEKIINKNWQLFADRFGRKDQFRHHIQAIVKFRNSVAHNKPLEGLALAEGETALIWLETMLPSIVDPAYLSELQLSEEDYEDDDEELDSLADDESWSAWKKRMSRRVLKPTTKIINLVSEIVPKSAPTFRQGYIGFAVDGASHNFVILFPRASWVRFAARVPYSKSDVETIERAGLDLMPYNQKRGRVRIRIRDTDVDKARPILTDLIKRAFDNEHIGAPKKPRIRWNKETFMARIAEKDGAEYQDVAKTLLDRCESEALSIKWGTSIEDGDGAFHARFLDGKIKYQPFAVRTGYRPGTSYVQVNFGALKAFESYRSEQSRVELMHLMNEIPGVELSESRVSKYPSIPLRVFMKAEAIDQFFEIIQQTIDVIVSSREI